MYSNINVLKILKKLNKFKSVGTDGISTFVLKECQIAFSTILSTIFIKSYESSELPEDWKRANVCPIFKKGSKTNPANYRPISLTSVTCKIMERLIRDIMMKHLLDNNLISEHQHGFVKFKSCITNLLEALDIITETLNRGFMAALIFLDFSKAFDKVCHAALIYKLKAYGFDEKIINWIEQFLKNRKQRVNIGGIFSDWANVNSSVPQGSVLATLLFIIFINDMPEMVKNACNA